MPRHSPYALLRLNYLQQFSLPLLVLASCKNCCAHTFAVLMAKLCLFPLLFRKNLISRGSPLFLHVSLTLSVMYVSHAFFRIHMIRYFLIRFSMNIRPFGFHEHLNLFRCSSNSNEFKLPFAVFSSLNTGGQTVFLPPSASLYA